ncbi:MULTISPECIES: hypothetical protein [unclassified Mesorhizobium]|uniref:hypothetical protein n=1 Tax=unclassified Mesorhizobium TaxID=325217 RepID=UPI0033351FA0
MKHLLEAQNLAPPSQATRLRFVGQLVLSSFSEFADRRAARLNLDLLVHEAADDFFVVQVSGQPDLIDAFEMACSLGPIDCLVMDCERAEIRGYSREEDAG